PTRSGIKAPPTIAVHSRPEVASALADDRSSVIVKITGNMIELNRPIESATNPPDTPPNAATYTHIAQAMAVNVARSFGASNRASKSDPSARPTIAPPQ